ncbi:MAG: hypothetical protein ACW986_11585 [Promethearchaeota archaeon]|jgi:hypothetical protein
MKKTIFVSIFIIGLFLFVPFANISSAQASYVGVREGNKIMWKLGVHTSAFQGYFVDDLEPTLGNLFPLGPTANLTTVYTDWLYWPSDPPQSYWYLNVTSLGPQVTGTLLSPYDNIQITSTPVYAKGGWTLSYNQGFGVLYDGMWSIVNDTSSFLRQTLNLTLAFSPYGIMNVPLAPKFINWNLFITEFQFIMNSKGGLYNNVSAVALSNGYSLHIPAWGFENNSSPIDIEVKYNSNGVLNNYKFLYGGLILINYLIHVTPLIPEALILTIVWSVAIFAVIVIIVLIARKLGKRTIYIGS